MINAELNHNPYLLKTMVKFNGHEPRINSQIEKYERLPLKDWVEKVPEIFYHEMNGFDFDLLFVGTRPDYVEVRDAFINASVSEEEVRVILKNELGDADTKSTEIDEFISWLMRVPNRKFDFKAFLEEHRELFEGSYPFVIVQGNINEHLPAIIGVEIVETISELKSTDLTNTPILFNINNHYAEQFREDLVTVLKRSDIRQEQLFFKIDPALNRQKLIRVISDIGISNPQVVSNAEDAQIMRYLRSYAITEFVREAIVALRNEADKISPVLKEENDKSQVTNSEVHGIIAEYEQEIRRLKDADSFFTGLDAYILPYEFGDHIQILIDALQKWRYKKTKITGDEEIDNAAIDYNLYARKNFDSFFDSVNASLKSTTKDILEQLTNIYTGAEVDIEFRPVDVNVPIMPELPSIIIREELLTLKEITFIEAKADLFAVFLKQNGEENEPTRVVTSYLEQWRLKAKEIIIPIAETIIENCKNSLNEYYVDIAAAYHEQIEKLCRERDHLKNEAYMQLSDDEQKLQEDNEWFIEFVDRLNHIERG